MWERCLRPFGHCSEQPILCQLYTASAPSGMEGVESRFRGDDFRSSTISVAKRTLDPSVVNKSPQRVGQGHPFLAEFPGRESATHSCGR